MTTTKAQLAILGLPGSGKTTLGKALAYELRMPLFSTDAFVSEPWELQARYAMQSVRDYGIIEGITVARMFRRGFAPDCVLVLAGGRPHKSMASLIERGLSEFSGRKLGLPQHCTAREALVAVGRRPWPLRGR